MIEEILGRFPKTRKQLPPEYAEIYEKHYIENRYAITNASKGTKLMESWGHKRVARTAINGGVTLEIGAGTLNQLEFESDPGIYEIVEPKHILYKDSIHKSIISAFYDDISEIPYRKKYDRITSLYTSEHILNLPDVIKLACEHLRDNGIMSVCIPNEGRFLWRFAYQNITGREFRKRYGLEYEVIMHYVHCNTADEIEQLLRYYFEDVKESIFGISKTFAFYRYYECRTPILRKKL